jgi:acyl-CoA thioesterase-1
MLKELLLLLILLLSLVAQIQNPTSLLAATQEGKTLLVLGDSLSAAYGMAPKQGWVQLLTQRLQNKGYNYQVLNASISGDTTSGGRSRLSQVLQQVKPAIVILELGANDGLRGLSLKEMQKNLADLIVKSQQAGAKVLLLGMRIPPNYGKAYTEHFQQIYLDLATQYGVPLVPFFLEGVADKRALLQEDNLHPTAEAQEKILENVWKKMEEMLTVENSIAK